MSYRRGTGEPYAIDCILRVNACPLFFSSFTIACHGLVLFWIKTLSHRNKFVYSISHVRWAGALIKVSSLFSLNSAVKKNARRTGQQTDGPTDGPTERRTDRWTDGPTDRWTNGPTDRRTDGRTNRQTDGPTNGPTYRPIDRETECCEEDHLKSYASSLGRLSFTSPPVTVCLQEEKKPPMIVQWLWLWLGHGTCN